MKDKKSLISKLLIGGGLLVLICGIFCFFGSAVKMSEGNDTRVIGSLFPFMFGTKCTMTMNGHDFPSEYIEAKLVGGTTALFAIEMVIIVLAVILLIGIFAKKLQKKQITIGCCIVCVLALVAVILTFCSKKMIVDAVSEGMGDSSTYDLGSAGISYGVLGIVGILATGAGLFIGKDEVAAA